jgi:hypothetical protein
LVAAPSLWIWIGDQSFRRIDAPDSFSERDWMLGVVAIQVEASNNHCRAQVRAHRTGFENAFESVLQSPSVIHIRLDSPAQTSFLLPVVRTVVPQPHMAELHVLLDGQSLHVSRLEADALETTVRAFGHTYCRYRRDGGWEAGFDLTDFVAPTLGEKVERTVRRELSIGQTVSYLFVGPATP